MECLMCQNVSNDDCLTFCGAVICGDCEAKLMEQTVDEPGYDTQIQAFRQFWQRQFLAARDRHLGDGEHV